MSTYYVANAGSDSSADPTNIATPWKTLDKVYTYSSATGFASGDQILFKRGDRWRERFQISGNKTNSGLTISAYGTGDKPAFSGGMLLGGSGAPLGYWTRLDADNYPNVWSTDTAKITLPYLVGQLLFNGDTSYGNGRWVRSLSGTAQGGTTAYITLAATASSVDDIYNLGSVTITGGAGSGQTRIISNYIGGYKRAEVSVAFDPAPDATSTYTVDLLATQGHFYYDETNDRIDLYSVSDPDAFYTSIEAMQKFETTRTTNSGAHRLIGARSDITISNIRFEKVSYHLLHLGNGSTNIIIEDCEFSRSGGAFDTYATNASDGNGVFCYGHVHGLIVRRCVFDHIWETCLSLQDYYTTEGAFENVYFYQNTGYQVGCGMDIYQASTPTGTVTNIYYCHNSFYDVRRWQDTTVVSSQARGMQFGAATVSSSIYIYNNIFHTVTTTGPGQTLRPYISVSAGVDWSNYHIDYNCYYGGAVETAFVHGTNEYTLAEWQAATGHDAHSIASDPAWVTNGSDFHLKAGSPCVDKGVVVAGVGQQVVGDGPDIGAYELPLTGFFKLCPFRKA